MTDINAVVEHYITLRDHKSKLDAEHKTRVAEIDAQMKNAEAFLLNHLNESGLDRVGVGAGTVFVQVKTMPSIKDKASFVDYIKQSGHVELLQLRVSSTAVKEFMENNNQQLPPGVDITTAREVTVRRK
jgi:hypothetical protein